MKVFVFSFLMAFQVTGFVMVEQSMTDKTHRFTFVISESKLFLPFCFKSSILLFILSLFAIIPQRHFLGKLFLQLLV